MEDDLEFLINALSVPNTLLTEPYDEGQLLEMRESFKTLQKLLRRNPTTLEASLVSSPRSKAGGGTARRQEQRALSSMLALVGGDYEHASTGWKSADSGTRSSPIVLECGLQPHDLDTVTLSEEDEMALVPYNKLHNDRSDSETTLTGMSFTSSSISVSFPVHLVWDNKEYAKESTDSETTLKPDGQRSTSRGQRKPGLQFSTAVGTPETKRKMLLYRRLLSRELTREVKDAKTVIRDRNRRLKEQEMGRFPRS